MDETSHHKPTLQKNACIWLKSRVLIINVWLLDSQIIYVWFLDYTVDDDYM